MLPFLNKEDLKELAYKIINKEVKGVRMLYLYPFLDYETLDEIVNKLIEEKNGKDLTPALPFISKEAIGKIYEAIEKGELTGIRKEMLLPFLDQKQIKDMFDDLIKNAKDEDEFDEEAE